MAIYIAGPMRGVHDYNYPRFNEEARRLRKAGHEVVNPAENFDGRQDLPRHKYLARGVQDLILNCDSIGVLPGWELSEGARLEVQIALSLGYPIYGLYALREHEDMWPVSPDTITAVLDYPKEIA